MKSLLCALALLLMAHVALADEPSTLVHGSVESITSERTEDLSGMSRKTVIQDMRVKLDSGELVTVYNDRVLLTKGDALYIQRVELADGVHYVAHDADRRGMLVLAVALFALATAVVGGMIGVRALVALAGTILFMLYGLVPLLASGYPPVFVSLVGAACMLAIAMAVTHGITRGTAAAFGGALLTVFLAIGLGEFFVHAAHLSGFADDAANLVIFSFDADLNMQGLLLGALIIGVLGIVDDLAVTQVATVTELRRSGVTSFRDLYAGAMRVGREHLGAVVNTLVLAYAGASLPLLILFTYAPAPLGVLLNSEVIAVEIIRAAVGGAALALVIPVATYLGILIDSPSGEGGGMHHHSH